MSSNNDDSLTVCFDVGGTVYKVSRSLLETYPDTMLARMASKEWRSKDDGTDPKPLFIDRDAKRFRYCLDYMRDAGEVHLPFTVSREAFLKDLAYYGFEVVDSSAIVLTGAADTLYAVNDFFTSRLDKREAEARSALVAAESLCKMQIFALCCAQKFHKDGSLRVNCSNLVRHPSIYLKETLLAKVVLACDKKAKELSEAVDALLDSHHPTSHRDFGRSLAEFGLKLKEIEESGTRPFLKAAGRYHEQLIGIVIVLEITKPQKALVCS